MDNCRKYYCRAKAPLEGVLGTFTVQCRDVINHCGFVKVAGEWVSSPESPAMGIKGFRVLVSCYQESTKQAGKEASKVVSTRATWRTSEDAIKQASEQASE